MADHLAQVKFDAFIDAAYAIFAIKNARSINPRRVKFALRNAAVGAIRKALVDLTDERADKNFFVKFVVFLFCFFYFFDVVKYFKKITRKNKQKHHHKAKCRELIAIESISEDKKERYDADAQNNAYRRYRDSSSALFLFFYG